MQTQHTLAGSGGRTDEVLLLEVLDGKLEAYGELYERYYPMARAIAFKHTSNATRVDDIVSEAFARILQALKNGKGPHSYMGGYLATTIAHLAGEHGLLAQKEIPSEQEHLESMGTLDETVIQLHESDEVISAFTSLPERWQTVLWLTEIEARKPREIAAAMNLSPNAVSALAVRAKESLREGFLRAHQNSPATPDCNRFSSHISPYVRGSLSQKRSDALRSHMETCNYCTSEYLSLVGINKSMRSWIFPVLAGLSIWTTDGAAIVAPLAMTTAADPQIVSAPAQSLVGSGSTSHHTFSLLSPKSWGTSHQLLAGAATLTAAVVAISGGMVISNPSHEVPPRVATEDYSTNTPVDASQKTPTERQEEKPAPLGVQFDSNPFNSFAAESQAKAAESAIESAFDDLVKGGEADTRDIAVLAGAAAPLNLRDIAEATLSSDVAKESILDKDTRAVEDSSSTEKSVDDSKNRPTIADDVEQPSASNIIANDETTPASDASDSESNDKAGNEGKDPESQLPGDESNGKTGETDDSKPKGPSREPVGNGDGGISTTPGPSTPGGNVDGQPTTPVVPGDSTGSADPAVPGSPTDPEAPATGTPADPTVPVDPTGSETPVETPVTDPADTGITLPAVIGADGSAPGGTEPNGNGSAPGGEVTKPVSDIIEPVADIIEPISDVIAPIADITKPVADPVDSDKPAGNDKKPAKPKFVPGWYGNIGFNFWFASVPWQNVGLDGAASNQKCYVEYSINGSTYGGVRYIPSEALNSPYTNYSLAGVLGYDQVLSVTCI